MPNYDYSAYESEATDALRLAMLRLHISEVEDLMDADTTGADMGVSHASLEAKLRRLQERRKELEARVDSAAAAVGGMVGFGDRRNVC